MRTIPGKHLLLVLAVAAMAAVPMATADTKGPSYVVRVNGLACPF